jgi:general secretion pathway protein C
MALAMGVREGGRSMFLATSPAPRWWPAIFFSLLAVAAQLDARGILAVVDAIVVDSTRLAGRDAAPLRPPPASPHVTDARAILARNPFDSATGGLLDIAQSSPRDPVDPSEAPDCDGMRVAAIAAFDDPAWSLAAIVSSASAAGSYLRVRGGELAGNSIAYVGTDRVWMTGGDGLCQMQMFKPVRPAATNARPAEPAHPGVEQVGPREFRVDRGLVEQVLENPVELARQARIEPELEGGRVAGIRLRGVRAGTLLAAIGIQDGDRLERVNGFDISSPEKALEAYARLRTAAHLTISITRHGQPMALDYDVE